MKFTVDTKISEVFALPEFRGLSKYLIYSPAPFVPEEGRDDPASGTIRRLSAIGWSPEGIVSGLNYLYEETVNGRMTQYFIYPEEACKDNELKKDVNVIRLLPEKEGAEKTSVVLAAGGAYNSVCTMVEALPTARHFSEAGYPVYLVTYRVGYPGVTPDALDDLAAVIRFLSDKKEETGFLPENYAIGGYSAGANLISGWGTGNNGWKRYGLEKPRVMFPVYTFIDLKCDWIRTSDVVFLKHMFGENFEQFLDVYNIAEHVDKDFPPCYIVCGRDDVTVPPVNSERLKALLDKASVPAILEEGDHAPHGFGDGTGTDVEGWPERAIAFMESL